MFEYIVCTSTSFFQTLLKKPSDKICNEPQKRELAAMIFKRMAKIHSRETKHIRIKSFIINQKFHQAIHRCFWLKIFTINLIQCLREKSEKTFLFFFLLF